MIPFLPLRLHYTATAPLPVPRYSGSMWRSGFGANLRELACVTGAPSCTDCPVRQNCAYGLVFDTIQPATSQESIPRLNARHREQPHPYVLSPSGDDEMAATVDFTLIGPALPHLPLLLRALRRLRPTRKLKGEWLLSTISQRSTVAKQSVTHLWQAGQSWPTAAAQILECPPVPPALRVILEHPLRLRVQDEYLSPKGFSFTAFFTALLRRMEMLHGLSGSTALDLDFPLLVNAAKALEAQHVELHWQDWARYSTRQKQTIPMGGVIGSFELRGDLTAIWPLLDIGQWLHVGKGAVMGLGRYRVEALAR